MTTTQPKNANKRYEESLCSMPQTLWKPLPLR